MTFGSRSLGLVIGSVFLVVLIMLELLPLLGGAPTAPDGVVSGPAKFGSLFSALPIWVKVWMHFQDVIIASSLFFVLWRKEAQIYALAMITSHLLFMPLLPMIPVEKIGLGLASVSHFIWVIPLIFLVKAWPKLNKKTGYGTWVTIAIGQLIFSLSFDIPQGISYLFSVLS